MATVEEIFAREYPLQHASFTFHNYMQGITIGFIFVLWAVYHLCTFGENLEWYLKAMLICRISVFFISLPIRKQLFDKFKEVGHSGQNLTTLRNRYMAVFRTNFFIFSQRITQMIMAFDGICFLLFLANVHNIFWSITKFNILKQVLARIYLYYHFPWAQINATKIWNMWNNVGYSSADLDRVSKCFIAGQSEFAAEECCICMTAYGADDMVRQFWCKHHFHMHCVDEWMHDHKKCPYCQQAIEKEKVW